METTLVTVQINGKPEQIAENASIRNVLELKGINPNLVACELNLKVIRRAQLGDTILQNGDTLEIIRMMGGG